MTLRALCPKLSQVPGECSCYTSWCKIVDPGKPCLEIPFNQGCRQEACYGLCQADGFCAPQAAVFEAQHIHLVQRFQDVQVMPLAAGNVYAEVCMYVSNDEALYGL